MNYLVFTLLTNHSNDSKTYSSIIRVPFSAGMGRQAPPLSMSEQSRELMKQGRTTGHGSVKTHQFTSVFMES
jgi:hypothetical protein